MNVARVVLLAALCLASGGCFLGGKKSAAKVPTPPAAPQPVAQQPVAKPAPIPEPEPLPPTPAPSVQDLEPVPVAEAPAPRPVPAVKPPVRRAPVPAPAPAAANPVPPPPPAPVAPPPQLREILSGERRQQFEAEYQQDVTRANAVLKLAAARTLNAAQRENVGRIRTFLAQAAAAREGDISTALQLSRRADLLAQDLQKALR